MSSKGKPGEFQWDIRAFGDQIEERWAKAEGRRRAVYASLFRRVDGIGYEGFRRMCVGELAPRKDIMEQVAAALNIDPREFPEYRTLQMMEACRRHPREVGVLCYELVMETAARLDEKTDVLSGGKNGSFQLTKGRKPSSATQ